MVHGALTLPPRELRSARTARAARRRGFLLYTFHVLALGGRCRWQVTRHTSQLHPDSKNREVRKAKSQEPREWEWRPTNELNKVHVERGKGGVQSPTRAQGDKHPLCARSGGRGGLLTPPLGVSFCEKDGSSRSCPRFILLTLTTGGFFAHKLVCPDVFFCPLIPLLRVGFDACWPIRRCFVCCRATLCVYPRV
jgi:hypothetical protein